MATTYYQLLEIPKNAKRNEIKASYRRKAKIYHPDVTKNPEICKEFIKIHEAYIILSDKEKRAIYDKTLAPTLRDDVYLWCYNIPNPLKVFLLPLGIFLMLLPVLLQILSLAVYIPAVIIVKPLEHKEKNLTKSIILTHRKVIGYFDVFGKIGSSIITIV